MVLSRTLKYHFLCFSEYHLLSIYMENGDLRHMLDEDNKRLHNHEAINLTIETRIRILYHVGSAIQFLHKPVPEVRYGMNGHASIIFC